jgi:geranylgeranyl diphosphate synthase, type II
MTHPTTALIQQYLERWTPRVDARLGSLLPPADADPAVIHEAMRYSVMAGGKRLRPALVLLGARAAGADEEPVLGVACAVELIHTYSLIHDDLPAMDDDDLRRGRPSCHKQFGEAVAILAGDALNTHAFAVIAATAPDRSRVADLVLELCRAAGTEGMVGGQVADLAGEGAVPSIGTVQSIHERKTGALLASSLRLGAIAVGAGEDVTARLTGYGRRMGLAFQIIDDVLDEEGESAVLGKTAGKDKAHGKQTYPAAIGAEGSGRGGGRLLS